MEHMFSKKAILHPLLSGFFMSFTFPRTFSSSQACAIAAHALFFLGENRGKAGRNVLTGKM